MAVIRDRYELEIDVDKADRALGNLKGAVAGFVGALSVDRVVDFGNQIVRTTDEMTNMRNRISLVTGSQEEMARTMADLTLLAQQNRASFSETVDLYGRLSLATESLGFSQEQVMSITSKFQQALAISGADANTAEGAMRQFAQAMGSGTVRGDEFNSIVEALGPALNIMARESGYSVGQLREMSQAGDLTAEVFAKMLLNSEALSQSFNGMQSTTAQLETALGDAFDYALVRLDEALGLTDRYRESLVGVTRTLDSITGREGALVNIEDPSEIFEKARTGVVRYDDAITELQSRLTNAPGLFLPGVGLVFEEDQRYVDTLRTQIAELERLKAAQKSAADTKTAAAASTTQETAATEAATAAASAEKAAIDEKAAAIREEAAIRAETLRGTQEQEISLADARKKISENEQAALKALNTVRTTRAESMAQEIELLSPLIEQNSLYSAAIEGVNLSTVELNENISLNIDLANQAIAVEDSRTAGLDNMRAALVSAAAAQRELNTAIESQPATRAGGPLGFGNLYGSPSPYTTPVTGARALGGLVTRGQSYLVNEGMGREVFYPGQTGTVIPLGEGTDTGGGLNINFTIQATDTVGFDAYLNRRRGDIVNLVRQAIQENRGRF